MGGGRDPFLGQIESQNLLGLPLFKNPSNTCNCFSEIQEILELVREIRVELLWKAYREETARFKLGRERSKPKRNSKPLEVKPLPPPETTLFDLLDKMVRNLGCRHY